MATRHIGDEVIRRDPLNSFFVRLISLGLLVFIALIFFVSILLMYTLIISPDSSSTLGGLRVLSVVGDSMNPSLNSSDLAIVKSSQVGSIKKGDMVSFYRDSAIITHRVYDVVEDGIITKGDNNKSEDDILVAPKNLIGKVIFVVPKGDYFLSLAKNPFFTFIIFLLLLINISILFRAFYI